MRSACLLPSLGLLLALSTAAHAACPVFVLERQGADVVLRRELLEEGEVAVYTRDVRSGVVALVLPVGPGRSADLVRMADADRIVVRFAGGRLSAQVRRAEGDPVLLPTRALADLRREHVRISVTIADSLRRAFHLWGYDSVTADPIGPAENLFAGRLPPEMARTGAVVQTETWSSAPAAAACGIAPLERDRWLFVRGRRADGAEAWFVLDLGAAESIVSRAFVADGQPIEPLSVAEHSAAGTRRLPYAPAGATGSVQSVLGATTFASLAFGSARFDSAAFTVLAELPQVFGRPVAGILGLDLLRGCRHLRIEADRGRRTASLVLERAPSALAPIAQVPFSWVGSHLMVRGTLSGRDTRWILDSGSPGMVLDSLGAPPLAPATAQAPAASLGGLDGARIAARVGRVRDLALGALTASALEARVAPLPVFAPLREPGVALGVLGVDALLQAQTLEIDFERRVVRWLGARR